MLGQRRRVRQPRTVLWVAAAAGAAGQMEDGRAMGSIRARNVTYALAGLAALLLTAAFAVLVLVRASGQPQASRVYALFPTGRRSCKGYCAFSVVGGGIYGIAEGAPVILSNGGVSVRYSQPAGPQWPAQSGLCPRGWSPSGDVLLCHGLLAYGAVTLIDARRGGVDTLRADGRIRDALFLSEDAVACLVVRENPPFSTLSLFARDDGLWGELAVAGIQGEAPWSTLMAGTCVAPGVYRLLAMRQRPFGVDAVTVDRDRTANIESVARGLEGEVSCVVTTDDGSGVAVLGLPDATGCRVQVCSTGPGQDEVRSVHVPEPVYELRFSPAGDAIALWRYGPVRGPRDLQAALWTLDLGSMELTKVEVPRGVPNLWDVDWHDNGALLLSVSRRGLARLDLASGSWGSYWAMPTR
jgi:hypothetical protein